eukprot:TRINITY_DN3281_c0_g5_i1.p3 TRINITY_DN3281_c0_g5~~TRINITY_DN3281_c0_g5_i1.p3  ORF type:complete len:154 (+),score=43.87 TRINITY_DN3281_c0_g5_i1:1254-1715(+)
MALGHGSNSNTTYLLFSNSFRHSTAFHWLLKVACALFMGLGVFFSGSRIIKNIGTKFVTDANSCAFVAQFTAMVVTLVFSVVGYPVSTSQAYFFSLYGLRLFHNNPEIITMDRKLMVWMVGLWATLPIVCVLLPMGLGELYFLFKSVWRPSQA